MKMFEVEPSPLLYQYLMDTIFQEMIRMSCAVSTADSPESDTQQSPTYEECNALRYIAGHVCSKVQKKIECSKHPHRDNMLLCLKEISDGEVDAGNSSEWINAVDRGGLCKVNESTFMTFYEMELKVRQCFTIQKRMTPERIKGSIVCDDNVLLHWSMVTVDTDDKPAEILLAKLAELYITIRGFSFTKTIVEQYKQALKKSTQKSKALRKNLPN